MTEKDDLNRAYALQSPDESRRLYADWAKTYDADFVGPRGYILHQAVADAFCAAQGQSPVLDLGAGTGICGQALAAHGLFDLHATDISPEMLQIAESKDVYQLLFEGDILDGLPAADATYPGIVSSGTFTCGHVGAHGLDEVARLLAPGGLAVISVRDTHFVSEGFAAKLSALEPIVTLLSRPTVRIYAEGSPGENAEDRALLLHLRKR